MEPLKSKRSPFNPIRYDKDIERTIRENYAQTKAVFILVRNLQIEVQELRDQLSLALKALRLALEPVREDTRLNEAIRMDAIVQGQKKKE